VIDEDIDKTAEHYLGRYPRILETIDLDLISSKPDCLSKEYIDNEKEGVFKKFSEKEPVSVIYMYHTDYAVQTLTLDRLRAFRNEGVHIIVVQQKDDPKPKWAELDETIHVEDPFSSACTYENVIEEKQEQLAEVFHNHWLPEEKTRYAEKGAAMNMCSTA